MSIRIAAAALLTHLVLAAGATAQGQPSSAEAGVRGYLRYPAISGDRVFFAAEGDLWSVASSGGIATRLTTHPGNEGFPKVSPDGTMLAFSAEYHGNTDVFVMPAAGGEPRRLTFHPAADEVMAWSADGKSVVFRTTRQRVHNEQHLFSVPAAGGAETLLPVGMGSLCDFNADGSKIAFNRWSVEFRTWKRYKGGTAPELWVGDLKSGAFSKITNWVGADEFPMWIGERIYFASDRDEATDRANIFSCNADGSDVRQHTRHADYDCRWPDADARTGRVVYMLGGDLWLLDTASGNSAKIDIALATDRVKVRPRPADPARTVDTYDLSPDGHHVAVSSRGEAWLAPTREGRIIPLTGTPGVRERALAISPDGKTVAAISDETGEQELVLLDAAGVKERRVLTRGGKGWIFPPVWSPDGKHIAYADLTLSLYIVNVETGESRTVDTAEGWEITQYCWSPDSRWLAYSKPFYYDDGINYTNTHVYIHSVEQGRSYAVSTPFSWDHSPSWDPEGRYLYFLSNRNYNPLVDQREWNFIVARTGTVCAAILASDGLSPLLPEEMIRARDEAQGKADKAGNGDADDAGEPDKSDDADKDDAVEPIRVDPEGIERRIVQLPTEPANVARLRAIKGKVLYLTYDTPGMLEDFFGTTDDRARFALHCFDLNDREDSVLIPAIRDYTLSHDGTKMAYRSQGAAIRVIEAGSKPGDDVKDSVNPADLPLIVDPVAEWTQIFDEAWRLQRDFYWDPGLAGVDWVKMREAYRPLVARISTRAELNDLIGQLIAELGTSHTYVFGGDLDAAPRLGVGLLGADLAPDAASGAYRFVKVLRPEPFETNVESPLTMSHARVNDGDYLFAINGRPVSATENVYERLADLAGAYVSLTVGSTPDRAAARDVVVRTLDSEATLRYRDWCRRNREYVVAQTNGRIGYFHLPDMGGEGLVEFIKFFYPQARTCEALIIDDRYNGGGNVSTMIIERLSRQAYGYQRPRRGVAYTLPEQAFAGPLCVLINHWSASDGDMFPEGFRLRGLGPVIGQRSWGGVVGIRADKPFIDGGMSTQPEFAWWEPNRGWNLENEGVTPDIEVDNTPADEAAGRDAQLDRAIAEMRAALEKNPVRKPQFTPAPNKSGK